MSDEPNNIEKNMTPQEHNRAIVPVSEPMTIIEAIGRPMSAEELRQMQRVARQESKRKLDEAKEKLEQESGVGRETKAGDVDGMVGGISTGEQQNVPPEADSSGGEGKKTYQGFWGKVESVIDKAVKEADEFAKRYPTLTKTLGPLMFAKIGAKIDDWFEQRKVRSDERKAQKEAEKAQKKAEKDAVKTDRKKTPPDEVKKTPKEETPAGKPLTAESIGKAVAAALRDKEEADRKTKPPKDVFEEPVKQQSRSESEAETEINYQNISYAELRIKLKNETNPKIINAIKEEKFRRAVEADNAGYYDFSQQNLKKIITETLTANDIDTVDENLLRIADNAENSAKLVNSGEYMNDPRLKGVVLDVVQGEIDAVRLDIYLGMSDAELNARNINREETRKQRDELEKTRLGFVSIRQPAANLRAEPSDELLDEYARHNVPGAEERLRRRQLERQAREEERQRRLDEEERRRREQEEIDRRTKQPGRQQGNGGNAGWDPAEMSRQQIIIAATEELKTYPKAIREMYGLTINEVNKPSFLHDVFFESQGIDRLSDREKIKTEWIAMGKVSSGCNHKTGGDDPEHAPALHPNKPAQSVSNKEFDALNAMDGVFEAVSLYTVFLVGSENGKRGNESLDNINVKTTLLGENAPVGVGEGWAERWNNLNEKCPEDIFWIENKDQFEAMRDSVAYWLCANRNMDWGEAQLASINAWNMVYLSYLPEWVSSRYVHNKKMKKNNSGFVRKLNVGIPLLFSTRAWETVRPQDRWEIKTKGGEAWGPLGAWSMNQKNKLFNKIKTAFGVEYKVPEELPSQTMATAFHYIEDISGHNLVDVYHNYGMELIQRPERKRTFQGLTSQREGVYSGYQFDYVDYAQDLTLMFTGKATLSPEKLGNVYEKLGLKNREKLTIITSGVNLSSKKIKPRAGWIERNTIKGMMKKDFPEMFDK